MHPIIPLSNIPDENALQNQQEQKITRRDTIEHFIVFGIMYIGYCVVSYYYFSNPIKI